MEKITELMISEKISERLKKILNDLNHFNVKNICSLHFYVKNSKEVMICAGYSPSSNIDSFIMNQIQNGYLVNSSETGDDNTLVNCDTLVSDQDLNIASFRSGEDRYNHFAMTATTFIVLPKLLQLIREGKLQSIKLYTDADQRTRVEFLTLDWTRIEEVNYDIYGDYLTVLAPTTSMSTNNFFRKREQSFFLNVEKVQELIAKFKNGETLFEYGDYPDRVLFFKDVFAISKPTAIAVEYKDFVSNEDLNSREVFIHVTYKDVHHYVRYVYIRGLL